MPMFIEFDKDDLSKPPRRVFSSETHPQDDGRLAFQMIPEAMGGLTLSAPMEKIIEDIQTHFDSLVTAVKVQSESVEEETPMFVEV